MAAIGRFQKGDELFHAKVVDGELYRLQGDVFGSPSFDKKPLTLKGVKTLTPIGPSKVIAVGLNYAITRENPANHFRKSRSFGSKRRRR